MNQRSQSDNPDQPVDPPKLPDLGPYLEAGEYPSDLVGQLLAKIERSAKIHGAQAGAMVAREFYELHMEEAIRTHEQRFHAPTGRRGAARVRARALKRGGPTRGRPAPYRLRAGGDHA